MASPIASSLLALAAALRVVATTPDVADMTRQIGGDRVEVTTLAAGTQDPHKVPVKPSFVTKLNRADVLVVEGDPTRDISALSRIRAVVTSGIVIERTRVE